VPARARARALARPASLAYHAHSLPQLPIKFCATEAFRIAALPLALSVPGSALPAHLLVPPAPAEAEAVLGDGEEDDGEGEGEDDAGAEVPLDSGGGWRAQS